MPTRRRVLIAMAVAACGLASALAMELSALPRSPSDSPAAIPWISIENGGVGMMLTQSDPQAPRHFISYGAVFIPPEPTNLIAGCPVAALVVGLAVGVAITAGVIGVATFAAGVMLQLAGAFLGVEIEPKENPGFAASASAGETVVASIKVAAAASAFEQASSKRSKATD